MMNSFGWFLLWLVPVTSIYKARHMIRMLFMLVSVFVGEVEFQAVTGKDFVAADEALAIADVG